MILRDYQQKIFDEIYQNIRNNIKKLLVVSPTGSGKTATFSYIASRASLAENDCLILVHRTELVAQTRNTLDRFNVPHGIIQAGRSPNPTQKVQLGMVQTIARRIDKIKIPKLIIVDECHHCAAGQYKKIITSFPDAVVIGFTATPIRLDGKGLKDYFDQIILGPSVEWLMQNNHLCRPKYYAPPVKANLTKIHKRGGDYATDELAAAMTSNVITGDAVSHYKKICPNARAIVFCVNIRHAEHVMQVFNQSGIPAGIIKGDMSDNDRKKILSDFQNSIIKILVSIDVVSEGFDVPSVEAAILLRCTSSLGLHLQQIGRILRPAEGKQAVILDHVGNINRHGFAEDHREWNLEGTQKTKKQSEQSTHRQCESCYCMYLKTLPACPECGQQYIVKPIRKIEQVDGELIELKAGPLKEKLELCKTRDDLKKLAKARGYKPGFVWYKAKEMGIR